MTEAGLSRSQTGPIPAILGELVACDTQNPPRNITPDHPVFQVVHKHLAAARFQLQIVDHGKGCVSMLAQRGNPRTLFNVHLDTVPCGEGWASNPLKLRVEAGRAYGRGTCDIKGAAAALIHAASTTPCDMAILFTTDEEGTDNCCVRRFCESANGKGWKLVVVAEPTECRLVAGHRGYLSTSGRFAGIAAHTSESGAMVASANHRAVEWAHAALKKVHELESGPLSGKSLAFNIGRIDGGTKNNMVASRCDLSWSMRPPEGTNCQELMQAIGCADSDSVTWEVKFTGEPLPGKGVDIANRRKMIEDFAGSTGLEIAPPVSFWTEAAIFGEYGLPAVVLGPGNIVQAHRVDEWVEIAQLERATSLYSRIAEAGNK